MIKIKMPHVEVNPAHDPEKPCRTCVDFKTWSKQQRNTFNGVKVDVSDKNYDEIGSFY